MADLSAIILAAGLSQRMGSNKLLLPLGNSTVLGTLLASFPFTLFTTTLLVVSHPETSDLAADYPVDIIVNSRPERGKSSSIRLAIDAAPKASSLLFITGDQPFTRTATIAKLIDAHRTHPEKIIVPVIGSRRANPVIFPRPFRSELSLLTGDSGGRQIIERFPHSIHQVECTNAMEFLDIDTEQDLIEAELRLIHP